MAEVTAQQDQTNQTNQATTPPSQESVSPASAGNKESDKPSSEKSQEEEVSGVQQEETVAITAKNLAKFEPVIAAVCYFSWFGFPITLLVPFIVVLAVKSPYLRLHAYNGAAWSIVIGLLNLLLPSILSAALPALPSRILHLHDFFSTAAELWWLFVMAASLFFGIRASRRKAVRIPLVNHLTQVLRGLVEE